MVTETFEPQTSYPSTAPQVDFRDYSEYPTIKNNPLNKTEAIYQELVNDRELSGLFTNLNDFEIVQLMNQLRKDYAHIGFNSINFVVTLLTGYAEKNLGYYFEELNANLLSAIGEKMIAEMNGTDNYRSLSHATYNEQGEATGWYIGTKIEDNEVLMERTLASNQIPEWQQDTNRENLNNLRKLKALRASGYTGRFFEFSPAPDNREKEGYFSDTIFVYEFKQQEDGPSYENVHQYWLPKTSTSAWQNLLHETGYVKDPPDQDLERPDIIKFSNQFCSENEERIFAFIAKQREKIDLKVEAQAHYYRNTIISEAVASKILPIIHRTALEFARSKNIQSNSLAEILNNISALQLQFKYRIQELMLPEQATKNTYTAYEFSKLNYEQQISHMRETRHNYYGCNGSVTYLSNTIGQSNVFGESTGMTLAIGSTEINAKSDYEYFLFKYPDYIHLCQVGTCARCSRSELLGPCAQCRNCDEDPTNQ